MQTHTSGPARSFHGHRPFMITVFCAFIIDLSDLLRAEALVQRNYCCGSCNLPEEKGDVTTLHSPQMPTVPVMALEIFAIFYVWYLMA